MSKVAGAIPSWYWPVGVPRRISVPQQPVERLLRRQAAAAKERPAIESAGKKLTYGELVDQAMALAGGIQGLNLAATIAVAEHDGLEALLLALAGLFADKQIYLFDPGEPTEIHAARLQAAGVAAVLTTSGAGEAPQKAGLPILGKSELVGTFRESMKPKRATDPALLISSDRGIVIHSHFSLIAMWTSLAAFIPRLREMAFLCTSPVGSWEALAGIVGALLQGMPVVFCEATEVGREGRWTSDREGYSIVDRFTADELLRRRSIPPLLADLRYLFVSTGYFAPRWREQMEKLCGRPIYPIWGLPEVGPIVAPHPTWFPRKSHGFPLVNVSLVPFDSTTGRVSIVPWEMLEQAEVCVETLSGMIGYAGSSADAGVRVGKLFRTRQVASIDNVGVVTLHSPPPRVSEEEGTVGNAS